jgi:hypothetical protein
MHYLFSPPLKVNGLKDLLTDISFLLIFDENIVQKYQFKFNIMKALKWIAYISADIGLLLVILGAISALAHVHILQVRYIASYFEAANSFFLITIVIFLYLHLGQHKKE